MAVDQAELVQALVVQELQELELILDRVQRVLQDLVLVDPVAMVPEQVDLAMIQELAQVAPELQVLEALDRVQQELQDRLMDQELQVVVHQVLELHKPEQAAQLLKRKRNLSSVNE